MSRKRIMFFEIDDKEEHVDFGTYVLLLYYANQLDSNKARLLFNVTSSEYYYRLAFDLPKEGLTYEDDDAHFDVDELQQVINFLNDKVIVSLQNENQDLIEKYGGKDAFYTLFNNEEGFLNAMSIDQDEFYYGNAKALAYSLKLLINLFQYALSINKAYTVNFE